MILKYLLEKEFKQFFRNPFLPRLTALFPVMVMLVIPWIATMDVKDIRVAVADMDRSTYSAQLAGDIGASSCFILADVSSGYGAAMEHVAAGRADAAVEIPAGFEKDLLLKGTTPVRVAINTVNGMKGILGGGYLGAVMAAFSQKTASGGASLQTAAAVPRVECIVENRYNPLLDYKLFMIPALMIILLIVMCGFLPALNIVSEKERGTIEQINVTPVPRYLFIFAKLIPYWLMGMAVLTICMALAYFVYGLYPAGNVGVICLFSFLFILSMSGLGLVVSNHSSAMQQAMLVMFFFIMVFQLMSGLLTPIRSMPEWAQWLTVFNPARYYIRMMRLIYLKGGGMSDLTAELSALSGFVLFFGLWAVWSYRKRE
jgi:ABC-2 type transport system permease protein